MKVLNKSPDGDEHGKRKGPNQRHWRRIGPWVVALLIRILVDRWLDSH